MNELTDKPFIDASGLAKRYGRSKRTIDRWMALAKNPFPRPKIGQNGISCLWSTSDVLNWENKSIPD